MLHYRPIDIRKDKEIILELQCRINYECESPYFQDKSYEKYHKKWMSSGQTKVFLSHLRKSMKDKRTIAVMVEKNHTDYTDYKKRLHREVVGYMWVQFFDVIGYNLTYTEISELAVEPKYQRKGIASRMIKYIEDISRRKGIKYIRSGTGILNIPSQKLQDKLGYKPVWTRYEKKLR
jgi:ribosomal protein S18 acetylase RimI-like enzyme